MRNITMKDKFDLATSKLKKLLIGTGIVAGLTVGGVVLSKHKSDKDGDAKEVVAKQKTNYDAVEINNIDDMYKLFDLSLNIIFAELVLEEVPMQTPYDDHGKYKGRNNTIGVGSTYSPINIADYNKPGVKWYHIYTNPRTFANTRVSHEDMLKLVIGWAKYRTNTQDPQTRNFTENKTILERMFNKLKGASLRPNEFSAIFCACYNNESVLNELCGFVSENYNSPLECANEIMFWSKGSNPGLNNRCILESMVYLNADNFCESMMDMQTCPTKRASCLYTDLPKRKKLNKFTYRTYSDQCRGEMAGIVYNSGAVSVHEVCKRTEKYFTNKISYTPKKTVQELYQEALAVYKLGNHKKALSLFLDIEKHGASGADLYNDIAVTYLNLHEYDKCIEYCQKIMKTIQRDEYAKACYNAGRAYEASGNLTRALKNYQAAKDHYNKYGISGEDKNIDYVQLYDSAIVRINTILNSQVNKR